MVAGLTPAALLLAWAVLLASIVSAPWPQIVIVAITTTLIAFFLAAPVLGRLLRRTRWLLLTVLVLFGWMTPGMPIAGLPGATVDGLLQGAEQCSRLLVSLAMVAVLLGCMPTERLLAGCHVLMRPLRHLRLDIDRFILRLALTMRQIDKPGGGFELSISLQVPNWRHRDTALILIVLGFAWVIR